jgi:hypothetical protein
MPIIQTCTLKYNYINKMKDREGDQRGGEWELIKILLENLTYTPNPSRNPSLLARPRLPSYRLAIGPQNVLGTAPETWNGARKTMLEINDKT